MNPPAQDRRQRRHSMATVRLARQLYGDGNAWTPTQIRGYLQREHSIDVAVMTIRCWVVPGEAEIQRQRNLESYHRRRGHKATARVLSKTPVLDRMLELRGAGVTFGGIAKVVGLDLGLRLTSAQVRYYVNERREPKRLVAA